MPHSQMPINPGRVKLVWSLILLGTGLWIVGILAAPWLAGQGSPLGRWVYAVFEPVCHQLGSRCFILWGHPLAVCTRCLGIYSGFFISTLLYPLFRGFKKPSPPRLSQFLAVSVPIVIDTSANLLGIWSTSDWVRFGLGFIWGLPLPLYLMTGLTELVQRRIRRTDYSLNSGQENK